MSNQFEFRELLLKIQDLLSDDDRQRLHFLLGDDVPRNLRDDLSLGGTLRVLQSLFDKAIIADQDCVYLIEALDKIRCFDAARRLREYQQNQGQFDTQSLSLTDILWKDVEDDRVMVSRPSVIEELKDHILTTKLQEKMPTSRSPPPPPVIRHQFTEEQPMKTSLLRRILYTSLSCREWLLISLLLALIIALPLAMQPWKRPERVHSFVSPRSVVDVKNNARWTQNAITILGGQGPGDGPNQLNHPGTLDIDNDNTIYVVDDNNHRVIEQKWNQSGYRVVAGGKGQGNGPGQLDLPVGVIVEQTRESLIICDSGNRRLVRWSLRSGTMEEMLLTDLECQGLARDELGFLYVSDRSSGEVRRFRVGERIGTVVAGGGGQGFELNQLNAPNFFTFDRNGSIYVSDLESNRVTKWTQGAKEGIVVAGSFDAGSDLTHFNRPFGIYMDLAKTMYIVDSDNSRVIRWREGMKQGEVVVGGNGRGNDANQLNNPVDIGFDRQGNLYVADYSNHRIQKFLLEHD